MDAAREALAAIAASARETYGPADNMRVRSSGVVGLEQQPNGQ